jgi:uncharacterized protein (UPF0332 family)
MIIETKNFLDKAGQAMDDARTSLTVKMNNVAGRECYMAAFHAAQAYIYHATKKIMKTHNGVQTEFARLTKNTPSLPKDFPVFLTQSYNLKAVADYEMGPGAIISTERVVQAIDQARNFINCIKNIIETESV